MRMVTVVVEAADVVLVDGGAVLVDVSLVDVSLFDEPLVDVVDEDGGAPPEVTTGDEVSKGGDGREGGSDYRYRFRLAQ